MSINVTRTELNEAAKSLSIEADIDFDNFERFAQPLATALDCRVIETQWGADRHQWLLDFEGTVMQLNYEFYGDICWLSVENSSDVEVLAYLQTLLERSL
ncbi:DUF3630 family protein [Shewanella sp. Scap07]|uniref:DUF3630 family protein n=1 Tax=Shewanella sp. Scap07 TaxID=2589987 RepID=UPI0015C0B12F|nr:DUF3630 family protein [Shewanella sp. Scap07]QLE83972.1 DUF3630 family protein [Shewanella sp. Scap07]